MSKRCSASTCFNCQITNKSVEYFCYPKHAEFACKWAERAGRTDLIDKPLHNIIKYYLCSAHFADSCFLDPPHNTKLIRSVRPFCVPLPTIFAPTADFGSIKGARPRPFATEELEEASGGRTRVVDPLAEQSRDDSPPGTNTFRLAGLEVVGLQSPCGVAGVDVAETAAAESDDSNYLHILDDIEQVITDDVHYVKAAAAFEEDEPEQLVLVVDDAEEEDDDDEERPEDRTVDHVYDDGNCVADDAICGYNDVCGRTCRLCAQVFENDEALIRIFDQCNDGLAEDVTMLMPNMISETDGRPQQICTECYTKTVNCAHVIREFHTVQEQLFSGT